MVLGYDTYLGAHFLEFAENVGDGKHGISEQDPFTPSDMVSTPLLFAALLALLVLAAAGWGAGLVGWPPFALVSLFVVLDIVGGLPGGIVTWSKEAEAGYPSSSSGTAAGYPSSSSGTAAASP